MYLHVHQIYDLKHSDSQSNSRFTYSYWNGPSSLLYCFDVAAILECTSGLNEGVQTRAWCEAKQSPHCTKADALKKSDLQVASGRSLQQRSSTTSAGENQRYK